MKLRQLFLLIAINNNEHITETEMLVYSDVYASLKEKGYIDAEGKITQVGKDAMNAALEAIKKH